MALATSYLETTPGINAIKKQVWDAAMAELHLIIAPKGSEAHKRVTELYRQRYIPAYFKFIEKSSPTSYGWSTLVFLRTNSLVISKTDPQYAEVRAEWDAMKPEDFPALDIALKERLRAITATAST